MLIPNKNSPKVDFKSLAQNLTDDDKFNHEIVNPERIEAYIKKLSDNLGLTTKSTKGKDLLEEVVGSSRVDLQACKLEYSIVSPK